MLAHGGISKSKSRLDSEQSLRFIRVRISSTRGSCLPSTRYYRANGLVYRNSAAKKRQRRRKLTSPCRIFLCCSLTSLEALLKLMIICASASVLFEDLPRSEGREWLGRRDAYRGTYKTHLFELVQLRVRFVRGLVLSCLTIQE